MKKFEVKNPEALHEILPEILKFINLRLTELKLNSKEAVRAELMCEEALIKLLEQGDFTKKKFILVNVKKFLGDVSIDLSVPGSEFDFYIDAGISFPNYDAEDDYAVNVIRNLVLRSFSSNIKYKHQWNYNNVRITAFRSPYSSLYQMLTALILAVITGFAMKNFVPEEITAMINGNFFEPFRSVLLNGLKMCAIPIMFFSIVSCFSQIGGGTDLSKMKRAGGKMFFHLISSDVIATCIGVFVVLTLGTGKGMNLTAFSSSSSTTQNVSLSIGDTIRGFMPDNFLKPFFEANMIQLVILAILIGTAINTAGSKIIVSVFDEINKIFMKIMELFLRFMPLLVFLSITSMFLSTGVKTLLLIIEILFAIAITDVLIWIIYYVMIAFVARLNPSITFKKSFSSIITAMTTCSCAASIPEEMKASQKLGISEKISSFLISLGTLIGKNAFCVFLAVITLSVANMYGIEITLSKIFWVSFYSLVLPIAMPSMPGAGIIALSSIFVLVGCPLEGLAVVMCVESFTDMFHTATEVMSILVSTLIVAKSENQFDIEKYKS